MIEINHPVITDSDRRWSFDPIELGDRFRRLGPAPINCIGGADPKRFHPSSFILEDEMIFFIGYKQCAVNAVEFGIKKEFWLTEGDEVPGRYRVETMILFTVIVVRFRKEAGNCR